MLLEEGSIADCAMGAAADELDGELTLSDELELEIETDVELEAVSSTAVADAVDDEPTVCNVVAAAAVSLDTDTTAEEEAAEELTAGGKATAPNVGMNEPLPHRQRQSHSPLGSREPVPVATAPGEAARVGEAGEAGSGTGGG